MTISSRVVFPGTSHMGGFVALSESEGTRVFEKHILSKGSFYYPGAKNNRVDVTDEVLDALVRNFAAKVCPIVQFPVADDQNRHTEDPIRNLGEVIGLVRRGDKLYAQIEVRSPQYADAVGKTILGASASIHLNYLDTRSGERVGPTLLHVLATNRPHLRDLEGYQAVIAASADDGSGEAVVLTAINKEEPMLLDEMLAALRSDHNIDVAALQEKASRADSLVALSAKVQETFGDKEFVNLSAGTEPSVEDLSMMVEKAGERIVALTADIEARDKKAAQEAAENRVDSLIKEGKILPATRDAQITLLLTDSALFESLLPETPIINLSGTAVGVDEAIATPTDEVSAEVARITNTYVAPAAE